MKRNKLITILLIFMFSFSIAHSFVVEKNHLHIDGHGCVISYENHVTLGSKHSHQYHCELHNHYILSASTVMLSNERISLSPSFTLKPYTYYQIEERIKPPIS